MENASKALYIAAGVLIGVMILTIAIYLSRTFTSYSTATQERVSQEAVVAFNNRFLKFQGRTDIKIQEVVSLKNYVIEYDKSLNYDINLNNITTLANGSNDYVDVWIGNRSILTDNDATLLRDKINDSDYIQNEKRLSCIEIKTSSTTGKVYRITFRY